MNLFFRILLSPLSLLYGIFVGIYQGLYLSGILRSVRFNIPIISIGNLTVGGTGKSPHAEYLIRFLKDYIPVGLISRGYLRKTRGHINVTIQSTAEEVGDEPLQIKLKFPEIPVAVNENRAYGIPMLLKHHPDIKTIIMDDGYQHLQVKPGLNILLTDYNHLYADDYLLPSGRLREWRYGSSRADVVVVTKCPEQLSLESKNAISQKLRIGDRQSLFFSKIAYGLPYNVFQKDDIFPLNPGLEIVLISGIAQSENLLQYLYSMTASVKEFKYEDHHFFTIDEVRQVIDTYKSISHFNKILLTTEKDAVRMMKYGLVFRENDIKLYTIPIEIEFDQKIEFDRFVKNHLLNFKA